MMGSWALGFLGFRVEVQDLGFRGFRTEFPKEAPPLSILHPTNTKPTAWVLREVFLADLADLHNGVAIARDGGHPASCPWIEAWQDHGGQSFHSPCAF